MVEPNEHLDAAVRMENGSRSVEAWAAMYVACASPAEKLTPPVVPTKWAGQDPVVPVPSLPGRGEGFSVVQRASKMPKPGALGASEARAKLLHTFLHHEVQAAELYCRALLLFSSAPAQFREGLLRVALDEIRHAGLYQDLLEAEGRTYGCYPVRDWFWQRGLDCNDPVAFVSFVGLGLEGANLDHSDRFEQAFQMAGAESCARVQALIGREEEAHVRFAQRWFETWTDGSFQAWCRHLPEPLSPLLFRGAKLNIASRLRAGQRAEFLDELIRWRPSGS